MADITIFFDYEFLDWQRQMYEKRVMPIKVAASLNLLKYGNVESYITVCVKGGFITLTYSSATFEFLNLVVEPERWHIAVLRVVSKGNGKISAFLALDGATQSESTCNCTLFPQQAATQFYVDVSQFIEQNSAHRVCLGHIVCLNLLLRQVK